MEANSMINKRFLLLIILVVISSFITAQCAPAPTPEAVTTTSPPQETQAPAQPPSEKPVTITVWWFGETEAPGAEKWLKESADLYTKAHPNVTFDLVLQNIDNYIPAFKAAAAAKEGPDIQYFWAGVYTLEEAWAGNIVPISDYVDPAELAHWGDKGNRLYNGKIWSMPWYMMGYVTYYNRGILQKSGLDPDNPPQTWADFMDAMAKVKAAGYIPIVTGSKDGYAAAITWSDLNFQALDSMKWMKEATVGTRSFTDPEFLQAWEKMEEMINAGYYNDDVSSLAYYEAFDRFARGEAAFANVNNGFTIEWQKTLGADLDLMRTPRYGTGKLAETAITANAQGLAVTSFSPNKEIAADFLVSLHQPERLQAWWNYTGIAMADDRFDLNQVTDPLLKKNIQWMLEYTNVVSENNIPSQLFEQGVIPAVQLLFQKNGTAEDAAQLMEDAAQAWRDSSPPDFKQWEEWAKEE
jgi:raffinose/stachyose/melibiose transport system substrate-binding protein